MTEAQERPASQTSSGNWWTLLLRGIAAVLFGLFAVVWPGLTLAVLVIVYGAYAVVDGVFTVIAGFRSVDGRRRALLLAEGILGVVAGLIALVWPSITAVILLYIIAFWAILGGLLRIATAILLRREIQNEWAMAASGVLSVLLGVILGVLPGVGLLSLAWLIGAFALGVGATLIWLSFKVRGRDAGQSSRVT
ncbi:MAG: HdeD family acid-resistance protein [Rubrobacter sp.]